MYPLSEDTVVLMPSESCLNSRLSFTSISTSRFPPVISESSLFIFPMLSTISRFVRPLTRRKTITSSKSIRNIETKMMMYRLSMTSFFEIIDTA